tara:strand:+ start:928 stop:1674 length:747 start_codon:yes stop_codon:yes gene_type:complete
MKILIVFVLAIVISSCGPSAEQIKEEIDLLYSETKAIPINDPCSNLKGYESLQKIENEKGTTYYLDITKQKIEIYTDLCNQKIESEKTGDWRIGTTYDDFGDPTGKSININTWGTFSNSATSGSDLKVTLAYSFNRFVPTFYLYEYGSYPVTSYGGYSYENIMDCTYRDSNNDNNWIDLHQYKNSEYLFIGTEEKEKEGSKKLKKLIESGQEVRFVCTKDGSKYKFKFNFKYAENVKRKYNEWLESNN